MNGGGDADSARATLDAVYRADLCRRLGRVGEARASYERALALARQEPEQRFPLRRLAELRAATAN